MTKATFPTVPLACRVLAVLFFTAAILALLSVPFSWSAIADRAGAAGLERVRTAQILFSILGGGLTALYAGAAWCLWRAKSWGLSLLLAVISLICIPIGTLLGIATIVVLALPDIRAYYRITADSRN